MIVDATIRIVGTMDRIVDVTIKLYEVILWSPE